MNSCMARRPPAWELDQVSHGHGVFSRCIYYLPAVEDVHEGNGEDVGLLGAREVGDVSVQGDAL